MFRETVFDLQSAKLKLDRFADSMQPTRVFVQQDFATRDTKKVHHLGPKQKVVNMVDVLVRKVKDSSKAVIITRNGDSMRMFNRAISNKRSNRLMQFLFDVDSLQDSVRVREIEMAYDKKLSEQNLNLPFQVARVPTVEKEEPVFNEVTLGFANPITYRLNLGNKRAFLLKRISVPILFSVFLVAFTFLSFTLLYRNLLRQRKLADIKNEFISNITHELKTPIATVSVAIEALRSFNASIDPQRTKEYLDISANELQRLSLLVDKVLKLSMFEKKEIELKYEELNMNDLVHEVTSSMRLQFEKRQAVINVSTEGNLFLNGDRLHLVSVIFNLLDNALKYSVDKPEITIQVKESGTNVLLMIGDSGIGIPAEYHRRIFEKFFRVPTGNLHNAKGYGLGLSYVSHVIRKHQGTIHVESAEGSGSRFFITLPKHKA
jgi:two-component system phosphate regulon sensor histidine kinase PhoR